MANRFIYLSIDKVDDFPWKDDPTTFYVFFRLLFKANYKDNRWHDIEVKRGQLATSYSILCGELNLSMKLIRGAIEKLLKCGLIGKQSGNQFSVITIYDYDSWVNGGQAEGKQPGSPRASEGQAKGNTYNKDNKDNKEYIYPPYNPPGGDGESDFPSRLSDLEKSFAELSEENTKLKEENEKLKKRKAKKDAQESFDVRADLSYVNCFDDLWREWLDYKDEINKQYNTQRGARSAFTQLKNLSQGDARKAREILEQSYRKGWDGFFAIKDWNNNPQSRDMFAQQEEFEKPKVLIINGEVYR